MRLRKPSFPAMIAITSLLVGTWTASDAVAQACGSNSGRYVVRLQPGLLVFPNPTPDDFAAGWIEHGPVELDVRPRGNRNRPWVVCMRADSPDMGKRQTDLAPSVSPGHPIGMDPARGGGSTPRAGKTEPQDFAPVSDLARRGNRPGRKLSR